MKRFILLGMCVLLSLMSYGQLSADTIRYTKSSGGYSYIYKSKQLRTNQLSIAFYSDDEAYDMHRKSLSNRSVSFFMGGLGGIFVGIEAYHYFTDKRVNYTMLGVGTGMVLVSIPFAIIAKKQEHQAVLRFNSNAKSISKKPTADFEFGVKSTGLALIVNF